MKNTSIKLFVVLIFLIPSGCATYRTSSNIESEPTYVYYTNTNIIVSEGDLPDKGYIVIGPIEVSVKKLFIFNKDPTKEQANEVLIEKAKILGADAVINVTYESGIGFTTYGYMDAKGTAVKFKN